MLAELLSAAIRDEVPPLDERQATSEAVPASTMRLRGLPAWWLSVRSDCMGRSRLCDG